MPSAESSFYLPCVDISPWLQDPNSEAGQLVLDQVRAACTSTGFFQLTGHGLAPTVSKKIFDAAREFFALPSEVKQAFDCRKNVGFRGYDPMGGQSYESDVLPDLKEGFLVGTDLPLDDHRVVKKRFFAGQNVWPSSDLLPYTDFREPVEEYYQTMMRLCWTVMDIVAATLPYGPSIFDDFKSNEPACPMRLLHYPPTPAQVTGKARQLGSSAHTDFGAVTLLLQDEHEGLEVLDHHTGHWILVPPKPNTFVINLGDMTTRITGGLYKSSMHRVINKNTTDRYSVVFFCNGNIDFRLRRLDQIGQPLDDSEQVPTVEEHMLERLRASYKT